VNRTLLVGGSGTLGSELADHLLKSGDNLTLLSRSENLKGFRTIKHDLIETENIAKIDLNPYSRIIYLAQSRNYKDYPDASGEVLKINCISAYKLGEMASTLGLPFLYASTGSVYRKKNGRIKEEDPFLRDGELTMYAASKISTEILLRRLPNITIIRPFYVFGRKSDSSMLIPKLFEKVLNGETINLTGSKGLIINPIYARDAARAALLCFENEVKIANIAGVSEISLLELVNKIALIIGIQPKISFSVGDGESIIGDISKLKSLGFKHQYDLNLALEDFWSNYRN